MESLCFDKLSYEKVVLSCPCHLFLVLPFYEALKVEKVFCTLSVPEIALSFFVSLCLLFRSPVKHNVIVYCHQQEVEKELLHTQLCVCPILFIELLVEYALAERLRLTMLIFCSECSQSPIFLLHNVFQTSQKIIAKGLG